MIHDYLLPFCVCLDLMIEFLLVSNLLNLRTVVRVSSQIFRDNPIMLFGSDVATSLTHAGEGLFVECLWFKMCDRIKGFRIAFCKPCKRGTNYDNHRLLGRVMCLNRPLLTSHLIARDIAIGSVE
jgi:hypothetical protein